MRITVAVTGGSGKIGSAVIKDLLAHGYSVLSLDLFPPNEAPPCPFHQVDLLDFAKVDPILEPAQAICHLGEIPWMNPKYSPSQVLSHNVSITSHLIDLAAERKMARFIYTSSCQVYGGWGPNQRAPEYFPFDETHPLRPFDAYALSKVTNETFARQTSLRTGLPVSLFRFPAVVRGGPRFWEHTPHRLAHHGLSDGMGTFVHIDDAARAYRLAMEANLPGCEAYHFVADDIIHPEPIFDLIEKHRPGFPPIPPNWPRSKVPVLTDKARVQLNWQPTWRFMDHYPKHFPAKD